MDELKTNDYLRGIVQNLPESPGIYQYLNNEGTIIYVGKAKNLKRRVSSYFNREHESGKTRILVSKIADIRYIVVKTEEDALLLENNLIKKYKPRYNVLLKDDKTYPSICVQNEWFPRVFRTRKITRDGSTYFGPYSHIPTMYALLDLVKHLFPLRTCHHNLSPENIRAGKYKVCLEYHIKNCAGPCIGKQTHEEYMQNIAQIKEILKGNTREIGQQLYRQMQDLAAELKFEEAQKVKEKYLLLENYRSKSEVVSHVLHNIDVFSIEEDTDENSAFINYLHITNGAINQAFTFEYKKRLNESKEDLLALGIVEMRERYKSHSREIIVPFPLDIELKDVVFTVPQRGEKKTKKSRKPCTWTACLSASSASTTPTSKGRTPWQAAWSSSKESPRRKTIASTISRRWKGRTTMPRCKRSSGAVISALWKRTPPCPTSSSPTEERDK